MKALAVTASFNVENGRASQQLGRASALVKPASAVGRNVLATAAQVHSLILWFLAVCVLN
jgi:hypothetical protein